MKIIGGNFGLEGSAFISRDGRLVIEGAQKVAYSSDQISSVAATKVKEKKFGIFGFIFGAILLSIILGLFLNIVGVIIGIVIAFMGSYYSESSNNVEVNFKDGKLVQLECTPRGVKKLFQFAPA